MRIQVDASCNRWPGAEKLSFEIWRSQKSGFGIDINIENSDF